MKLCYQKFSGPCIWRWEVMYEKILRCWGKNGGGNAGYPEKDYVESGL